MRKRAQEGRCEGRKSFGYFEGEADSSWTMKALRSEGLGSDPIAARLMRTFSSSLKLCDYLPGTLRAADALKMF